MNGTTPILDMDFKELPEYEHLQEPPFLNTGKIISTSQKLLEPFPLKKVFNILLTSTKEAYMALIWFRLFAMALKN